MRKVNYRPRVVADLDGILTYLAIEKGSPQAAEQVAGRICESIELAAAMPTMGRAFEDEHLERSYRRILSGSYWIYYSSDAESLTIWRIFHTSRDLDGFGFHAFDA